MKKVRYDIEFENVPFMTETMSFDDVVKILADHATNATEDEVWEFLKYTLPSKCTVTGALLVADALETAYRRGRFDGFVECYGESVKWLA